jgi:hypothetical protein
METRGRKIKLTDDITKIFTDALSIGASRDMAARYAGVSYMSIYIWLKRGEAAHKKNSIVEKEQVFINLFKEVEKAEAEAVIGWQQVVSKAAEKDPVWAMKMLQLRDKQNYSPAPTVLEHSGPGGGPIEVLDIERVRDARWAAVQQQLLDAVKDTENKA